MMNQGGAKNERCFVLRAAMAFLLIGIAAAKAQGVTLNQYLEQVKTDSASYKGQSMAAEGNNLEAREADLLFTPKLFAEFNTGHDGKPSQPKMYDRVNTETYMLGVSQQFDFGLQSKLYYQMQKTTFDNAGSAFTMSKYWDATPKLELSMPVWGNGFGRTAQANEELLRAGNYAEQYQASYQSTAFLAQAEAAYWKLSAWSDVVKIQETASKSAQDILNYVNRKRGMNLGEQADVVQARALVEGRGLELQMARNEQREALRNFNKFLNRPATTPVDGLETVPYAELEKITVPQSRPGERYDVKATQAQLQTAKANAMIAKERNRPTLDIYANYALNGRDDSYSEAMKNAGYTDTDTGYIGMRFNMPLNFGAAGDAKAGADKSVRAAEYNREYALYAQEQDWINLTQNLTDARDNLVLLGKIEQAQKTKLDVERTRLRQGRTTTYQVLLFEQDYSAAALNRVKSAANILGLQSQIKLYQASPEEGK
ncbi:TolC family protein [Bdellovibrio sp. SKB1291214]|uniref:TolC family protein n=1 Tax=Bdellovibrio sp. SKB1291214 TaxID=1732569 RepID=UPI0020CF1FC3|nr:TolC family protein [Bdellovibrio sp. SKB1291214]UYL08842.1 TolC family protein [Bdellovibrio sp. SKB1291214]